MSRREEVEKLKNQIAAGIGPVEIGVQVAADEALERLADMALESIPDRYTPREEVTEGWWFCSWAHDRKAGRFGIKIHKEDVGDMLRLKAYTDFLPVPAWLVEGIET